MIPRRLLNIWKYSQASLGTNCASLVCSTRSKHETARGPTVKTHDAESKNNTPTKSMSVKSVLKDNIRESPIILRVNLAQSPAVVFSIIENYRTGISVEELCKIITSLDKNFPGDYHKETYHDHPGFLRLCTEIREKAAGLPRSGLYCSVYIVCKYGSENETTRRVVESLKGALLDMDWKGLLFNLISIEKAKKDAPFVSDIKNFLVTRLEKRLWSVVESGKHFDEVEALCGSCRYLVSEDLQRKLVNIVMERHENLTADQSKRLLTALPRKSKWGREGKSFVALWDRAMSKMIKDVSTFKPQDFAAICYPWDNYIWNRGRPIVSLPDAFCEAIAQRAVNEKWPWNICATIGKSFAKKGFVHGAFLEYCIEQEMATGRQVLGLVALGKLNYKPQLFESYFKFCAKSLMQGQNLEDRLLSCAVFGFYPLPLIKQLFGDSARIATWSSLPDQYFEELSILESLHQAVRVECPKYKGPFPPEEVSTIVREKLEKLFVRKSIDNYLAEAVGGQSYVASRLFPRIGYHISHLLVQNTAGSLVPFNDATDDMNVRDMESFGIPSEYQKIAIQLHQEHDFLSDGKSLRGYNFLETRVMTKLGFKVVNINVKKFHDLREEEKIPFLLQEIDSQ